MFIKVVNDKILSESEVRYLYDIIKYSYSVLEESVDTKSMSDWYRSLITKSSCKNNEFIKNVILHVLYKVLNNYKELKAVIVDHDTLCVTNFGRVGDFRKFKTELMSTLTKYIDERINKTKEIFISCSYKDIPKKLEEVDDGKDIIFYNLNLKDNEKFIKCYNNKKQDLLVLKFSDANLVLYFGKDNTK